MYEFVQSFEDGHDSFVTTRTNSREAFKAFMIKSGYKYEGPLQRAQARSELQGEPIFSGAYGPAWGGAPEGVPIIRYEDWVVQKLLST